MNKSATFSKDTVLGGEGEDLIRTTLAWEQNTFNGGAGNDTVDYSAQSYPTGRPNGGFGGYGGIWVDLSASKAWRYRHGGQYYDGIPDTLVSIENAIGSNLRDYLVGDAQANRLEGLAGDDVLIGGAGADTLLGGVGLDTLSGGTGSDRFVFSTALTPANADTLTDFKLAEGDSLALDDSVFTQLAGKTSLANHYRLSTQAVVGGDDFIVYNPATGDLFYDPSGAGTGTAQLFATLANRPQDVTAAQFAVI